MKGNETWPIQVVWMSQNHLAFDALRTALITAPLLGYLDLSKEFIMETDASLKALGVILSQEDQTGKTCMITCASRNLRLFGWSMRNYSSTKLEQLCLSGQLQKSYGTTCWDQCSLSILTTPSLT